MSADWGPIIIAVVLFILLSPGLLFQLPSRTRVIEFGNMCTSGIAILCRQRHDLENQEQTQKSDPLSKSPGFFL
ncbi:hypothetical protein PTKIN_Ptkin07bG0008600 [Pterospermum kingtungense]